ncbi:MAG: hypothetical protein KDK70_27725, partial [Myxococcales bacterium]|nr:hypothetical protein [Myxococcales bacterium]
MSTPDSTGGAERPTALRFVSELLFRDWGLKAIAFVLAAIMFVSTRNEVTRAFTVPLKVVADPERVLLTELPQAIKVQARGPWTRINRMQDHDFGLATLDLKEAGPGPLEIDSAAIVMPPGVVLSSIVYDRVDLRFDPVVEREVEVRPEVVGDPAPDYELVRVEVQPTRWRVRGGESFVREVDGLAVQVLEIQGADHDVEASRAIERPPKGVSLVGVEPGAATVTVRAIVQPKPHAQTVVVAVSVPPELDPTGAVPRTYELTLSGPRPDFRVLEGLGVAHPLQAEVVKVEGAGKGG